MSRLLEGIRVVESGVLLNASSVGALLGDLGADVIKLERAPHGDYLRDFLGQITAHHSPAHVEINRNKRSVLLDLGDPVALDACWRLLDTADIFIDGTTAGVCDRLGIGYTAQAARNPGIVYCQYTGFGASGPYAHLPTHGEMMTALAGAAPTAPDDGGHLARIPDEGAFGGMTSGGEGTAAGAPHAAMAAVAALVRRDRTGEGAYIDVAASDAVVSQAWAAATYLLNDSQITDRSTLPGQTHRGAKYAYYATADDRTVLFCCIEEKFWSTFCRAVGRTELAAGPPTDSEPRVPFDFGRREEALRRELAAIFRTRTLAHWVGVAIEHRLPLGPAYPTLSDAIAQDPHLQQRDVVQYGEHPATGPFTYIVGPSQVQGQPWRLRHPAPAPGEHTRELLTELGLGM